MNTRTAPRRRRRCPASFRFGFVLAIVFALGSALHAPRALAATPEEKAAYRDLLEQRAQLTRQLERVDREAVGQVRAGESALVSHARQIALQDELDLVTLQLEIMATRLGTELPPPVSTGYEKSASPEVDRSLRRAHDALARGERRAMQRIEQEGRAMLASLDFSVFVNDLEE